MYIPKHFNLDDRDKIHKIIEEHSFATLISLYGGSPFATHLPLLLNKDEQALYGHFALPNEQWKDIENQQVLVIFQGPHAYISPTWYETTKAVPTWNYVTVHVYGDLEIVTEADAIYDSLKKLVGKYEREGSPYSLETLDSNFLEKMTKGIVPFKIKISNIEAKAKLSQNHPIERQKLVIKQLEESTSRDDRLIAALMQENIERVNKKER